MKMLTIAAPIAVALLVASAAPSAAAVNCGIINKDIERGRAPEEVAELQGVTLAQVKDCKAKGANATTDAPAPPKPDTAPKGHKPPGADAGATK